MCRVFCFRVNRKNRLPTRFATRTAIAAAETAAPTAETATETAAALFARLGLRLVDANRTPVKFVPIQCINRRLSLRCIGHGDKTKTLAATGHAIRHDTNSRI